MKQKKGLIALTIILVSSLMLFTSCKPHHPKGEFMFDYLTETLDLTENQQESLGAIKEELVQEIETIRENKLEMLSVLKTQLAGDSIDKEQLSKAINNHRTKMDSTINLAIDRLTSFHGELSPEQRAKLVSKLEKFEKNRSSRFIN